MTDTGLYDLDDSRELSNLPLSDDGIFGSERRKIKHLTIYYQTFPSKIGERENLLMQIQRRQCPRKVLITKISLKYQILIMIIQDLIVSKVVWEIETLRKKDSLTTKDKTLDRIVFGYLSSTKIAVHMVQEKAKLLEDDKVRKMLFPKIPIGSRLSNCPFFSKFPLRIPTIENLLTQGKRNGSQCQKYKHYQFRNKYSFRKRCNIKGSVKRKSSRFLQYIVSSNKEKWRNETSDQFETPQSVSSEITLQNGYNNKSTESSQTRGLDNISRFKRCIFSRTNFQETQKVSEILRQ